MDGLSATADGGEFGSSTEPFVADVLQELKRRATSPRATYRCQFHAGFGFAQAAATVPYLSRLGISHLYASPLLLAKSGSTHGYDVCDYGRLNPELGDENAWRELCDALKRHQMGLVLDIVPNHMSTDASNAWWNDVLENGESSPYAEFFDIAWRGSSEELRGKVLIPILAKQFGEALEAGEIQITYQEGAFFAQLSGRLVPLDPRSVKMILAEQLNELRSASTAPAEAVAEFESVLAAAEHLPLHSSTTTESIAERQREKEIIKRRLASLTTDHPPIAQYVERCLVAINGEVGNSTSFDKLETLLAAQSYRLCFWRVAADDINYRRFFDVNDLVAMRMEGPEVFYQAHRFVMELLAEGVVSGLRVDHVDGLLAPEAYLWRLQWSYLAALARRSWLRQSDVTKTLTCDATVDRTDADWIAVGPGILFELCSQLGLPLPADDDLAAIFGPLMVNGQPNEQLRPIVETPRGALPLFVLVEKILGPNEPLPESWPVAGTTGYDFVRICDRLFVPAEGLRRLHRDYARLTAQSTDFEDTKRQCKRLILRVSMASELQMLAYELNRISEQRRESRDFTLNMQRFALREILACFPVYRVYASPVGVSERDRHFVLQAVSEAKRRNPAVDSTIFDFIERVLLLDHPPNLTDGQRQSRETFAGRFQQVTSPVMAKGVEDTAFYVYCPLASLDEVGSGPELDVATPNVFHDSNLQRLRSWPHAMLATSTHDSKRNEDVRARLDVLAEDPRGWRAAVGRWMRLNRGKRSLIDGQLAPSRADEYLFYQCLLGIWPLTDTTPDQLQELTERLCDYMRKATLEAKTHTNWLNPNAEYDRAMTRFVTQSLASGASNRFLADFASWQVGIRDFGLLTVVSQIVLKLTSVGVPDFYQGEEFWNPRLVDPDNRITPNFDQHQRLMNELFGSMDTAADPSQLARELASQLDDPRLKMFVTLKLLQLRRQLADEWDTMDYVPLEASGDQESHLIGYSRATTTSGSSPTTVIIIVPRLWQGLVGGAMRTEGWTPAVAHAVWKETTVSGPVGAEQLVDIFTGAQRTWASGVRVADLLSDFPVAVLIGRS